MVIKEIDFNELKTIELNFKISTPFLTYEWLKFLEKDKKIKPVLLSIVENDILKAYFVGGIEKKFGLNIFGSPFEGWLTSNMGFITINEFNINDALLEIKKFLFKVKKCAFIRIVDYSIQEKDLNNIRIYEKIPLVYFDNSRDTDTILKEFKQSTRMEQL